MQHGMQFHRCSLTVFHTILRMAFFKTVPEARCLDALQAYSLTAV